MSKNFYIGAPIVVTGPAGPLYAALTRPNRDLASSTPSRCLSAREEVGTLTPPLRRRGASTLPSGSHESWPPSFGPALDFVAVGPFGDGQVRQPRAISITRSGRSSRPARPPLGAPPFGPSRRPARRRGRHDQRQRQGRRQRHHLRHRRHPGRPRRYRHRPAGLPPRRPARLIPTEALDRQTRAGPAAAHRAAWPARLMALTKRLPAPVHQRL